MKTKYIIISVTLLIFLNPFISKAEDYNFVSPNNNEKININQLADIKTFLRDNYKTINFIKENKNLKDRIWIYNYDLVELSKIINWLPKEDINDIKKIVELVKSDLFINNQLKKLEEEIIYIFDEEKINKTIFNLDNHIDMLNRSINHIWDYWLNFDLIEKADKLINILEKNKNKRVISNTVTKINDYREKTDIYKQELEENIQIIKEGLSRESHEDWIASETELYLSEVSMDTILMIENITNLQSDINIQIEEKRKIIEEDKISKEKTELLEEEIKDLKWFNGELEELLAKIDKLEKEKKASDKSDTILWFFIILLLIGTSYLSIKYIRIKKIKNTKSWIKTKTLQILKNWNEYSIEYNGVYNKWIKVLENNKNNITSSIDSFVKSMNKLTKTRWASILDKLDKLDIEIPDLKASGSTIYRLFLPNNIRDQLKHQNGNLIIKTDEQEIPWELMHDWDRFLSLKFPIARHIMTRESIRINERTINKKPKILFIINPTWDLPGTEKEVETIIKKLGKKAVITLIKGKKANSLKVFSLLWKDDWDIIHYSGHAYFNKENPDESGIILDNNHIISTSEIKRSLNWNPLIFLNACSSGKSISDDEDYSETGQDTIWLASSFIIGWAKWVVSTMWPVNDNIAKDFAIDFYSNFLKWAPVWESILEAKQNSFTKDDKNVTWASFVYYGNPNLTIDIK